MFSRPLVLWSRESVGTGSAVRSPILRLVAAAAIFLLLGSSAPAPAEESDHAHARHAIISITETALLPKVKRIGPEDTFGWLNYSARTANVSFDAEVSKKLMCQTRGGFQVVGDRLESGPVEDAGFASLCHLAVGEYDYRVEFYTDEMAKSSETEKTLHGKLVVE
jgi:hypothetical protein